MWMFVVRICSWQRIQDVANTYIYICTYIHTYIPPKMLQIHTHMHIYPYRYKIMHIYLCISIYTLIYITFIVIHTRIYTYLCVFVCERVCARVYVCSCVYVEKWRIWDRIKMFLCMFMYILQHILLCIEVQCIKLDCPGASSVPDSLKFFVLNSSVRDLKMKWEGDCVIKERVVGYSLIQFIVLQWRLQLFIVPQHASSDTVVLLWNSFIIEWWSVLAFTILWWIDWFNLIFLNDLELWKIIGKQLDGWMVIWLNNKPSLQLHVYCHEIHSRYYDMPRPKPYLNSVLFYLYDMSLLIPVIQSEHLTPLLSSSITNILLHFTSWKIQSIDYNQISF